MKNIVILALCALTVSAMAQTKALPTFSLKSISGAPVTQKTIAAQPSVVVFFKKGCPASKRAVPLLNKLQQELKGKAMVLGVMQSTPAEATAEAKKLGIRFSFAADPSGILVGKLQPPASLAFFVVGGSTGAAPSKVWSGLGSAEMKEALTMLAKAGQKLPSVNVSSWPNPALRGCGL